MWGYHLRVDAAGCNDNRLSENAISNFAAAMVEEIDMKAYGMPWVVHFGKDNPKAAGYTLVQLIETSNIIAHFCDHTGECYFDVWSCKKFDAQKAISVINVYFQPKALDFKYDERQAPQL